MKNIIILYRIRKSCYNNQLTDLCTRVHIKNYVYILDIFIYIYIRIEICIISEYFIVKVGKVILCRGFFNLAK